MYLTNVLAREVTLSREIATSVQLTVKKTCQNEIKNTCLYFQHLQERYYSSSGKQYN